jgi:hypothetical protein
MMRMMTRRGGGGGVEGRGASGFEDENDKRSSGMYIYWEGRGTVVYSLSIP